MNPADDELENSIAIRIPHAHFANARRIGFFFPSRTFASFAVKDFPED